MSLSILVVIEMFNACNSLSENESLLVLPIWSNPYLVASIALSMGLHFMILYVPFFRSLFQITPLNLDEWRAVVYISAPVVLIDEVLKWISNTFVGEFCFGRGGMGFWLMGQRVNLARLKRSRQEWVGENVDYLHKALARL